MNTTNTKSAPKKLTSSQSEAQPKRLNKYINVYITQSNYGQGWEDESANIDYKKAKSELKDYRNKSPYPSRLITRRVLRTDYIEGNF